MKRALTLPRYAHSITDVPLDVLGLVFLLLHVSNFHILRFVSKTWHRLTHKLATQLKLPCFTDQDVSNNFYQSPDFNSNLGIFSFVMFDSGVLPTYFGSVTAVDWWFTIMRNLIPHNIVPPELLLKSLYYGGQRTYHALTREVTGIAACWAREDFFWFWSGLMYCFPNPQQEFLNVIPFEAHIPRKREMDQLANHIIIMIRAAWINKNLNYTNWIFEVAVKELYQYFLSHGVEAYTDVVKNDLKKKACDAFNEFIAGTLDPSLRFRFPMLETYVITSELFGDIGDGFVVEPWMKQKEYWSF